jgi:hypothetical protein
VKALLPGDATWKKTEATEVRTSTVEAGAVLGDDRCSQGSGRLVSESGADQLTSGISNEEVDTGASMERGGTASEHGSALEQASARVVASWKTESSPSRYRGRCLRS